jgi:hypothetical protein
VTHRDGEVGSDGSPMGKAFDGIRAMFTELELDTAKPRAQGANQARVARGDHVGQVAYGYRLVKVDGVNRLEPDPDRPVAPILDAYRRAGGRVRTAVRIVNEELRIPAPYGGTWDRPSFLRLIGREAPDLLPRKTATGRRDAPATPAVLAKLLRCHCGRLLTPNRHVERRRRRETTAVSYYCAQGNSSRKDHPRVYVAESRLLPLVQAEVGRLRLPFNEVEVVQRNRQREAELEEERTRVSKAYIRRGISEDDWQAELAAIEAELEQIETAAALVDVPRLDWSWPPEQINNILRTFFDRIELGPDLMPVRFVWRLPAEYVA